MGQRRTLIPLATLGVLFGGAPWFDRAGNQSSSPILVSKNLPDGKAMQAGLAKENWTFEPIDPANLQASGVTQTLLTKQQAIDRVNAQLPALQKAPNVTGIAANLGKLANLILQASTQARDKVDPTFLTQRLVWIVTYAGLQQHGAGPPGFPGADNEFDVVIDAITGEQLMSFVWTR